MGGDVHTQVEQALPPNFPFAPRVPDVIGLRSFPGRPNNQTRNTVALSWIMRSIHEGLVKDWAETPNRGFLSASSLQIMRLSCSARDYGHIGIAVDRTSGTSGSLDVLHRRTKRLSQLWQETKERWARRPYGRTSASPPTSRVNGAADTLQAEGQSFHRLSTIECYAEGGIRGKPNDACRSQYDEAFRGGGGSRLLEVLKRTMGLSALHVPEGVTPAK